MNRRDLFLVTICLLTLTAGGVLAISRTNQETDLDAVVEIWADVVRDLDGIGKTITRVSAKREMEIGREIKEQIDRHWPIKHDPANSHYVAKVGEQLLEHTQRKDIQYSFHILESPAINAHALPGGGIYITTGMLDFLESEAELAAILGHEISHVDLRHCIDRIQYELAVRKIGGNDLAAITRVGSMLVGLAFSEQQEMEADAGGAILAAKARYDPRAAAALFERLAKFESQRHGDRQAQREKSTSMVEELGIALGKALQHYFATHPVTEARIRELHGVFNRNTRAWQGRSFYSGRSNYQDRIPRSQSERPGEWLS
jgi:predicted Zn-dependent protease